MSALLGDETQAFLDALQLPAPTSIRFNPRKASSTYGPEVWAGHPQTLLRPVPWAQNAFFLSERPSFTLDPLFHAGAYYVQEASSMKLESYLTPILPQLTNAPRVLDLCAAPGGKSTHLASLLPSESCLVSNEYIKNRALILRDNLTKWGHPNQVVCQNAPQDFARCPGGFDLILADVPCSGEGMFRKDPGAISEWNPSAVMMCAQRQKEIIAGVWPALRRGGFLIYSTCTYNPFENEENTAWICTELGAEIIQQEHCFPHRSEGEGFFISLLRKTDSADVGATGSAGRKPSKNSGINPLPRSLD